MEIKIDAKILDCAHLVMADSRDLTIWKVQIIFTTDSDPAVLKQFKNENVEISIDSHG